MERLAEAAKLGKSAAAATKKSGQPPAGSIAKTIGVEEDVNSIAHQPAATPRPPRIKSLDDDPGRRGDFTPYAQVIDKIQVDQVSVGRILGAMVDTIARLDNKEPAEGWKGKEEADKEGREKELT